MLPKTYIGTESYMSPQVLKRQAYTFKTDVWSSGVVFLNMLTLKLWKSAIVDKIVASEIAVSDDRLIPVRNCICEEMLVFGEEQRKSVQELIQSPVFHSHYQIVERKAMVWQHDQSTVSCSLLLFFFIII